MRIWGRFLLSVECELFSDKLLVHWFLRLKMSVAVLLSDRISSYIDIAVIMVVPVTLTLY